jgi:S1-C subfamily serine protease
LAGGGSPISIPYAIGSVKARNKTSVYGAGLGDMLIDTQMRLPPNGEGGPLLDEHGKAIGINTPNIHRPDTVPGDREESHALPMRVVSGFFKMAKAFPTSDQVWMGLAFRPLSPDEKRTTYQTLGQSAGVFIDYVWADGPAGESDIAQGDVLFSVDGAKIEHLHDLEQMLLKMKPDDLARLAILRGSQGLFRQVQLERRPAWAGFVNWRFPKAEAAFTQAKSGNLEP